MVHGHSMPRGSAEYCIWPYAYQVRLLQNEVVAAAERVGADVLRFARGHHNSDKAPAVDSSPVRPPAGTFALAPVRPLSH